MLETSELIFRSEDEALRLKIPFASIKSAKAVDGELQLEIPEGLAVFALGANAAKWCEKILHPKTRLEKLGVKPNANVSLFGDFDEEFLAELRSATKHVSNGKAAEGSELIFFSAATVRDLGQVAKLAKGLKGATALWIVYPKGKQEIKEVQVIEAGRAAGLVDVKVCAVDETWSGLKLVIRRENR